MIVEHALLVGQPERVHKRACALALTRTRAEQGRARKRPGSSGSLFTQQKKFNP